MCNTHFVVEVTERQMQSTRMFLANNHTNSPFVYPRRISQTDSAMLIRAGSYSAACNHHHVCGSWTSKRMQEKGMCATRHMNHWCVWRWEGWNNNKCIPSNWHFPHNDKTHKRREKECNKSKMSTNPFITNSRKYSWNAVLETIGGFHKWQKVQYALLVAPLVSAYATQYLFNEMQFYEHGQYCEEKNNATEIDVRTLLCNYRTKRCYLFDLGPWWLVVEMRILIKRNCAECKQGMCLEGRKHAKTRYGTATHILYTWHVRDDRFRSSRALFVSCLLE